MNFIYTVFGYPLGWVMWFIYRIIPNFPIALLLFTIVMKIFLLPLSIKQQKNTARMALFQPKIKEIQNKYANNRTKMNEELQNLYAEEGYNPTSGCLPLLIQFPILFGMIDVVYKPMYHLLRISKDVITEMTTIATECGYISGTTSALTNQIFVFNAVKTHPESFSAIDASVIEKIQSLNMEFLGINLAEKATWVWPVMLIPILAGVTALLSSIISTHMMDTGNGNGTNTNMTMLLMMPLMSVWISTIVAAGVGIYWIYNNFLTALQSVILYKYFNPKKLVEEEAAKREEQKAKDKQRREEAHARARARAIQSGDKSAENLNPATMSDKEMNRLKLAEARRRMAEKYGDEYVDVTDNDLK